jgi:hypothetical protein
MQGVLVKCIVTSLWKFNLGRYDLHRQRLSEVKFKSLKMWLWKLQVEEDEKAD